MAVPPRALPYVRRFNRVSRRFAERVPPFVVVHNVGRKSGNQYLTPVVAFAGRDADVPVVAIPLAWGRDAAWCRNVLAAGSFTLTRRRREHLVDEPRIVAAADAEDLVGGRAKLANTVVRPKEWIVGRLRREPAV